MAAISRVGFSEIWTRSYAGLLAGAQGKLATQGDYAKVFETVGDELQLPWQYDPARKHWSRFWSSYLTSPGELRRVSSDTAWKNLIPLRWEHGTTLKGPRGTEGSADVLLYPSAIAVVIRVSAHGKWPVDELASALATIRASRRWKTSAPDSKGRNLAGVASDLAKRADAFLVDDAPEPVLLPVTTTAAPTAGTGRADSFAVTRDDVKSCLAGLAVLGPPGRFDETRLATENTDSNLAGRIYVTSNGHTIWHPARFLSKEDGWRIDCLHHNQSDLVAHISALRSVVDWAADQIDNRRQIPLRVHPLVQRATVKLRQLHAGNRTKTYRSELAQRRIADLVSTLEKIDAAL